MLNQKTDSAEGQQERGERPEIAFHGIVLSMSRKGKGPLKLVVEVDSASEFSLVSLNALLDMPAEVKIIGYQYALPPPKPTNPHLCKMCGPHTGLMVNPDEEYCPDCLPQAEREAAIKAGYDAEAQE